MDQYSTSINSIRDERLDLADLLVEARTELLVSLRRAISTPEIALHDVWTILTQYYQLRENVISMVNKMDVLEENLISSQSGSS